MSNGSNLRQSGKTPIFYNDARYSLAILVSKNKYELNTNES